METDYKITTVHMAEIITDQQYRIHRLESECAITGNKLAIAQSQLVDLTNRTNRQASIIAQLQMDLADEIEQTSTMENHRRKISNLVKFGKILCAQYIGGDITISESEAAREFRRCGNMCTCERKVCDCIMFG
jgi:hypothetical protein